MTRVKQTPVWDSQCVAGVSSTTHRDVACHSERRVVGRNLCALPLCAHNGGWAETPTWTAAVTWVRRDPEERRKKKGKKKEKKKRVSQLVDLRSWEQIVDVFVRVMRFQQPSHQRFFFLFTKLFLFVFCLILIGGCVCVLHYQLLNGVSLSCLFANFFVCLLAAGFGS